MPLQDAHIIDQLAHDPTSDEVVLTMMEPRAWDGSNQRVLELQEKVNSYLSFALDGEMVEQLPQLAGKKIRLQLDCVDQPDPKTGHFLGLIQQQIGLQDIQFTVRVVPDLVCEPVEHECCGGGGGGCHCGEGEGHDDKQAGGSPEPRRSGCCGGGGGGGCGCGH